MKLRTRKPRRRRSQIGGIIGTLAATIIPMVVDQAVSLARSKGPPRPLWALKYPHIWKKHKEDRKKPDDCRNLRLSVWNPECRKRRKRK